MSENYKLTIMKELSIEEKAKRYDEAIERAKEMIKVMTNIGGVTKVDDIQYLFPELKESEDERIRKVLVGFFKSYKEQGTIGAETFNGIPTENILAWLDRQGEQKPAWSEEDEKTLNEIFSVAARASLRKSTLFGKSYDYIKWQNWLKSIKNRVQPQPKQSEQNLVLRDTFGYEDGRLFGMNEGIGLVLDNPEKYGLQKPVKWSEEDEGVISLILSICNDFLESFEISPASTKVVKEDIDKLENWLKSLKPQNRWKPSDEQMADLWNMVCECRPADQQLLQDIYYGLKTIRGE